MQVSLKLFDVAKQKQIGTASHLIATADLTAAGLERASKALYAKVTGATASGSIIVTANVKEGSVLLDGTPTATLNAGSARLSGVAAGKHDVSIESPGYQPSTRSVTVDAGSDSDAEFSLEKVASGPGPDSGGDDGGAGGSGPGDVPPPGAPPRRGDRRYKAAFVGSTVVGLAAGAMWAYSYTQIKDAEDQLAAGGNWNCTSPTTAEMTTLCKQGDDSKRMTWIMIPVTAAAGALAIYTFYKGFVQSSEGGRSESASARRRGKRRAQVAVPTITPTISPTGVGASVRIDF